MGIQKGTILLTTTHVRDTELLQVITRHPSSHASVSGLDLSLTAAGVFPISRALHLLGKGSDFGCWVKKTDLLTVNPKS